MQTLCGSVSLEAASHFVNLRGATMVFRNKATGALIAFRWGNSDLPTRRLLLSV